MDVAKIEELITVLEGSRSEELCVRKGDFGVCIKKGRKPAAAPAAHAPAKVEPKASSAHVESPNERLITAPMVGIFHMVDGIAKPGTRISAGQVVGSIESMKLLNDIVCDVTGTVVESMVEDGTPVEYGQPLCRVEKADG